jgi:hypothetical protein
MPPKSKTKKKSPLSKYAFLIIFFIIAAMILVGAFMQSNSGSTQTSISSTTSSPLAASDFYIVPTKGDCGFDKTTNLKAFILTADLQNNKAEPFHFVVAQVSVLNYTLTNGTVISSTQMIPDNVTSYGPSHTFDIEINTILPKTGVKMTSIDFMFTIYVQEVPGPITIPYNFPNANC